MKKKIEIDLRKGAEYPKLMFWGGFSSEGSDPDFVVLFSSEGEGVVVSSGTDNFSKVGYYSSDWSTGGWLPFEGNIKIKS